MMQSNTTPRTRGIAGLLALSLASALVALPAAAQDATRKPAPKATAAPKPAAAPKSRANLMTRDELRGCMDEQDRLQADRATIDREDAELGQLKTRIQAMDTERQQRGAALDPADEAGRQAIAAEAAQRDQEADIYNARLATLRERAAAYGTGRQAWVERCTSRNFDEMDEAAVRKERAQAARARK
jgi:hypothetical protein